MVELADRIKSFRESVVDKKTARRAKTRAKARKSELRAEKVEDFKQKARNDLRRASEPVTNKTIDLEDEARRSKEELGKLRDEVVPEGAGESARRSVSSARSGAGVAQERINQFIDEFDDFADTPADIGKEVEEPFLFDEIDKSDEELFVFSDEGDVPDPLDFEPVDGAGGLGGGFDLDEMEVEDL